MSLSKPFAFVLMPFDKAFDDVYKLAIQAAAVECEVVAERVDEQIFSETILERVYRQIRQADFIVADMTGRNSNVFYEVGFAHAHEKLCTLITQSAEDIPFDLKHHRHVIYNSSIAELKSKLKSEFTWMKSQISEKETPITCELKDALGRIEETEGRADFVVEITFMLSNKTLKRSPDIDALYFHTTKNWQFKQALEDCHYLEVDGSKNRIRHFVKVPVSRLAPGAWVPIKIIGRRTVWTKFGTESLQDDYRFKGAATLEIATSEGSYSTEIMLDVDTADVPF